MSTFEDDRYQWRETYFVLFPTARRPSTKAMREALKQLPSGFEDESVRGDDDGEFESATLYAPDAFAAIDVAYVCGEEVAEQIEELSGDVNRMVLNDAQKEKLKHLDECDARFDVLHFEKVEREFDEEEEEMLDPSALLLVLARLAELTNGIAIDPQSGTFMAD
ncbi:MAG: hypothetical protein MPJ50_08660 [Pirellulales bacterium]|nr:hypothetical protein [Pirellulales bacterium]